MKLYRLVGKRKEEYFERKKRKEKKVEKLKKLFRKHFSELGDIDSLFPDKVTFPTDAPELWIESSQKELIAKLMERKDVRKDFLFEWIVQEHLFRKFGEIYYYRNSYEIDCIAGNLRVEVKAGKPHRRYPKNVTILSEEDIPRFLLELEKLR